MRYQGNCRTGLDSKDANTALIDCRSKCDHLREINVKLLNALEVIEQHGNGGVKEVARAAIAIAKAKGETP